MSYKTLPMDDNTPQIELPYNYLIWKSGSDYIIKNTTTGVKTTGTVFATLLNSAIASATAGDSFFFRPGAYTILAEIDSSVGLNFYGSGIDNTIIRCGAGYAASNHILHFATTVATTPCHIDGITFDGDQGTGQTSAAQGLWIEGMDLTIENCKVMDAYNTGILVFVDDLAVSTVKIVNNTIINAGLGGGAGYGPSIRVDHRAGSTQTIKNVYISGNHCSSGGEHGIKVYDSTADNAEIIGNTILSTAKAGIWCQAGGSVANNVVREAGGNGIVIGDTGVGAAVNCHGNYVYSCGGVESAYRGGIYINNSSPYSTFIGNHIYDSFEHGIQTSSDYCTFVGNTIITAGGYGVVVVSGGDNNVFMDNIINTINKVSDSGSDNRWQNNTGYITETQTSPYTYIVYKSGSTYYAMNNTTGIVTPNASFATLVNTAITACNAAGGGSIYIKPGLYTQAAQITLKSHVSILGERGTRIQWTLASTSNAFTGTGVLGTTTALTGNAAAGDSHVHVTSEAAFAAKGYALIRDTGQDYNQATSVDGEVVRVASVSAGRLNLHAPLFGAYNTADTALAQLVTPLENVMLKGFTFFSTQGVTAVRSFCDIHYAVNCSFEDLYVYDVGATGIELWSSIYCSVNNCTVCNNQYSGQGYGIEIVDGTAYCVIHGNHLSGNKHNIAHGNATYGVGHLNIFSDNTLDGSILANFQSHYGEMHDCIIMGNIIRGAGYVDNTTSYGIQLGGRRTWIIGNVIEGFSFGVIDDGNDVQEVYMWDNSIRYGNRVTYFNSTGLTNVDINDLRASNISDLGIDILGATGHTVSINNYRCLDGVALAGGAIFIETAAAYVSITNCQIANCQYNGVKLTNVVKGIIADNRIYDNNQINAAAGAGEGVLLTACTYLDIHDNHIYKATGNQGSGIYEAGACDYNYIHDNMLLGNDDAQAVIVGANTRISDNIGYITENSGTATLLNGQTHVHVTHGLSYTPTLGQISIVWGENPTNVIADWWIDTIGATEFILNGVDPGASNLDFGWSVRRT